MKTYSFSKNVSGTTMGLIGGGILAIILALISAWVTHVVVCLQTMTTASVLLLLVGIIVPPIGWVHGILIWFGVI